MGSSFRITGLAIAALVLAACSKKENSGADTTAASSTAMADTSGMTGSTSSGTWTDANIFALLDEANAADSTAGTLAVTKGFHLCSDERDASLNPLLDEIVETGAPVLGDDLLLVERGWERFGHGSLYRD